MPLPRLLAQINKRVFNPREVRRGIRPVLTHTGRKSGETYRTPLDAFPVDGGYMFILMYGSGSDWVRNVLASGRASLRVGGEDLELERPRVLTGEQAWQELPPGTKRPPARLRVTELLRMDVRD